MVAAIESVSVHGGDARRVVVDVHVAAGLPGFSIVGLPADAAAEAARRCRAGFAGAGLRWPPRRVTVDLQPRGRCSAGPGLDLPIAVGLLVGLGALRARDVHGAAFVGELAGDGSLLEVAPPSRLLGAATPRLLVAPGESGGEVDPSGRVVPARTLRAVVRLAEAGALRLCGVLDVQPRSLDLLCARSGLGLAATGRALALLEGEGLAVSSGGRWRRS